LVSRSEELEEPMEKELVLWASEEFEVPTRAVVMFW